MQKLSCVNEFYLQENKKSFFSINGFALRLALRQGFWVTRKVPIDKCEECCDDCVFGVLLHVF